MDINCWLFLNFRKFPHCLFWEPFMCILVHYIVKFNNMVKEKVMGTCTRRWLRNWDGLSLNFRLLARKFNVHISLPFCSSFFPINTSLILGVNTLTKLIFFLLYTLLLFSGQFTKTSSKSPYVSTHNWRLRRWILKSRRQSSSIPKVITVRAKSLFRTVVLLRLGFHISCSNFTICSSC